MSVQMEDNLFHLCPFWKTGPVTGPVANKMHRPQMDSPSRPQELAKKGLMQSKVWEFIMLEHGV